MPRRIHSTEAKRLGRTAQLAGIALGATAVALWALSVPGLEHVTPAAPAAPPIVGEQQASQANTRVATRDPEWAPGVADRFELARAPRPVKEEPPVAAAEPDEPVRADPPSRWPRVTYLGPIYEADRTLAVVSLENEDGTRRQRIVPEGQVIYGDVRLASVERGSIALSGGTAAGAPRTVERGERVSSSVSWVDMPQAPTAQAAVNVGTTRPGVRRGNVRQFRTGGDGSNAATTAAIEQRLRERGIDPGDEAQIQAFRERMRRQMESRRQMAAEDDGGGRARQIQMRTNDGEEHTIIYTEDGTVVIETEDRR